MQYVEAHIAWLHLAENRVQVSAVVVQQTARIVHCGGNVLNLTLEYPAGRRIGHHQPCRLRPNFFLQRLEIDIAFIINRHLGHLIPTHHCRRRIGAVGGRGNDDLCSRIIPTSLMIGTDHRHAGEFTLGTGHGRKGHTLHAGNIFKDFLQVVHTG